MMMVNAQFVMRSISCPTKAVMMSSASKGRGRGGLTNARMNSGPLKNGNTAKSGLKEGGSITLHSHVAPGLALAAVSSNPLRNFLESQAAYFSTLGLPDWLVHWGHPGNMMVVLLAMGGYGALYLGWQIRVSEDPDVIVMAKDAHPKLAAGMSIFFALGALGGMMSLLMQDKPIFQSPHFITGVAGLVALALQAMLPLFFSDDPNARSIHAYLGTGIMALFFVHAALGLQLGLSI